MKPQTIINRFDRAGMRLFLGADYALRTNSPKALSLALRRLAWDNRAELVDHFLAGYDARLPGRLTPTVRRRVPRSNDADAAAMRELWRIAHSQQVRP